MKNSAKKFLMTALMSVSTGMAAGCAKNQGSASVEDSSTSGIAAAAAGGALTSSASTGALAELKVAPRSDIYASIKSALNPLPSALADSLCPTARSTASSCSASAGSMWLDYTDCTFRGKFTWNAVQELSMSSGTAVCGTFPNPGANGTLYRQFVTAQNSTTAGSATLQSESKSLIIDDASSNLQNFDLQPIAGVNTNGAYGSAVGFDANSRRDQVVIGHHITLLGAYDHSITGTLQVSESSDGSTRTVNGPLKVYHNILRVVGTSTFSSVVHNNVCCLPVSGSIQTSFAAGTNVGPTPAGSAFVGKTETLTFTGCGTATLQATDGSTASVSLSRCF